MQQDNAKKQQETVLPSFHSLMTTLGVSNNDLNFHNTNTLDRQTMRSLPQFASFEKTSTNSSLDSNTNIHPTCIPSSPPTSFNFPSTKQFNPQQEFTTSYSSPRSLYTNTIQSNSHPSSTPSVSSLLLDLNTSLQCAPQNCSISSISIARATSPELNSSPKAHYSQHGSIQHATTLSLDENHSKKKNRKRLNNENVSTLNSNNSDTPSKTSNHSNRKKQIKFIHNNKNYSVSPPPATSSSNSTKISVDNLELGGVTFSMEKESKPKKKRKSNIQPKLGSPPVNQVENSTNDSDYSSTSSIPLQNSSSNCPSGSTDNSSQNMSNPKTDSSIMKNSGLFMEFIGTSTRKKKQYRDIINYKDEFFTDSYSTEKRLRESNTKYRSKQPLNPNNKQSSNK